MRVLRKASGKAACAANCARLEQIPNIGPAMAADLRRLGIGLPQELAQQDAHQLYTRLCDATGQRQDPCVLDTFMAAIDFLRGAESRPWWHYTEARKAHPATPPALAWFSPRQERPMNPSSR